MCRSCPATSLQCGVWLTDSFPVALAKQGHRFNACVAKELADAGYCSTKKLYYYGVRVHVVARRHAGTLPCPEYSGATGASSHDGKIFDHIRPCLKNNELYADLCPRGYKAYQRPDAQTIEAGQGLSVLTSVKKDKGQSYLEPSDQWLSTAVSRVRQPIESLFGRLEEKTGIECASKVRSYNGLWSTSSAGSPSLCSFGVFYVSALNPHFTRSVSRPVMPVKIA